MRLRPSGKGGMLITNINAFGDYQQREAWTWEHQALLHARAVAGDAMLRARFEQLRSDILQTHVRLATLKDDVREMRARMRAELATADPQRFDIKQGAGGVADIEFLAQYWALRWAHDYPPVVMFADTIRQLESVASADLVPQSTIDILTHAYRRYRERLHHDSLEGGNAVVAASELVAVRAAVSAIWQQTMEL
jgi:glutamate-ammonia-ligase adenylyltransferase